MLSGFAGALISDHSVYWIGRAGGRPLIQRILKTRVLRILISEKSLERVEGYYEDHGGKTVLIGRFGPGLRSMTPLFAGVTGMKYSKLTRCASLVDEQLRELERLVAKPMVEQEGHGVREDFPEQSARQMPHVPRPHPLYGVTE